jgi:hypothetical protein
MRDKVRGRVAPGILSTFLCSSTLLAQQPPSLKEVSAPKISKITENTFSIYFRTAVQQVSQSITGAS